MGWEFPPDHGPQSRFFIPANLQVIGFGFAHMELGSETARARCPRACVSATGAGFDCLGHRGLGNLCQQLDGSHQKCVRV